MDKPKISIIACIAKNRGIGKDNHLLFDIPADLQHFKKITLGHPVIMGLNTYRSIGRSLPGRLNIVLSKEKDEIEKCTVVESIKEAIKIASSEDRQEIFFIGGGLVYHQAIKFADKLYLTLVDANPEADTFFPAYTEFKIIHSEQKESDGYRYKFIELERSK